MTQEFSSVESDFKFESSSKEYIPAPTKKMLKFHVVPLERTEQINNFKTTPKGEPNPDFGKPQPVMIFKAMLDEGEATGQIYSAWITGYYKDDDKSKPVYSMGDRSKLGKIAEAVAGSVEAFQKLSAGELVGMPFQCALAAGKKNPERLNLDIEKIMPPADDQVKVETDTILTDIPGDDNDVEDALMKALDEAK